uniref:Taste receptor type 2 member 40 n=1 Tax=Pyxicephalus adspersus TaxID=30357 RepID=A0AAV2ZTR6_PYXAD|nr:TPA: hypothetical protein GDO54_014831 [Pyxicephalus adspersus]
MGLVNILIQCVMTTQVTLWVFWSQIVFMKEIYFLLNIINMFLISSIYWLTSWLSAFYCISIANYTHQCFVWLTKRLSAFLPHLLLMSIGGSLIISIPAFWVIILDSGERTFENSTLRDDQNLIFYIFLGCCLPLAVTFLSIILTICSLLRHIWNMRHNNVDFDRSKLQIHSNAIKNNGDPSHFCSVLLHN